MHNDYLILRGVACIYAEMSPGDPAQRQQHEDVALAMLRRAVELWRQQRAGPNEMQLIERESAFISLRQRPEFQQLLSGPNT